MSYVCIIPQGNKRDSRNPQISVPLWQQAASSSSFISCCMRVTTNGKAISMSAPFPILTHILSCIGNDNHINIVWKPTASHFCEDFQTCCIAQLQQCQHIVLHDGDDKKSYWQWSLVHKHVNFTSCHTMAMTATSLLWQQHILLASPSCCKIQLLKTMTNSEESCHVMHYIYI